MHLCFMISAGIFSGDKFIKERLRKVVKKRIIVSILDDKKEYAA